MRTKTPELLAFEQTTAQMKSHSRKYLNENASLQKRITALRLDIIEKSKILKQWEDELDRKIQRSQITLFP